MIKKSTVPHMRNTLALSLLSHSMTPTRPQSKLPSAPFTEVFLHCETPNLVLATPELHSRLDGFNSVEEYLIRLCCTRVLLKSPTCGHGQEGRDKSQERKAMKGLRRLLKEVWLTIDWILRVAYDWVLEETGRQLTPMLLVRGVSDSSGSHLVDLFLDILVGS